MPPKVHVFINNYEFKNLIFSGGENINNYVRFPIKTVN